MLTTEREGVNETAVFHVEQMWMEGLQAASLARKPKNLA